MELTDSATYWLAAQGGHHHHHDDGHWHHDGEHVDFNNGDDIFGCEGDDILFGQDGDDTLRGDAGDDWLVGGDDKDKLIGGTGRNKISSGNENSSILHAAVSKAMINWEDSFTNVGIPFSSFSALKSGSGHNKPASFDFLTIDD